MAWTVYTARLNCGTVLSYEARSFLPMAGELVPCRRHGHCEVAVSGQPDGAAVPGRPGLRRARARSQEELLEFMLRERVTTVHALRRQRFTLRTVARAARAVFLDRGHWYAIADDGRSGEQRTFRIDRFETWTRTGVIEPPEANAPPVVPPSGGDWFADSDVPSVVLRLDPSARWAAERYPVREEREEGDALVVRMAVLDEQWLRTLLLRLGRHATVLEPVQWRELAATAARDVLARYEAPIS